MVLGLASDQDSTISHAAIMARSMGIPAVVQLGDGAAAMAVGRRAILDADNGTLVVEPDGAQIARVDCQIALSRLHGQQPDPVAALPCLTKGGTAFRLMQTCNLIDNEVPHTQGAAGIGIVRSESVILCEQSEPQTQTSRLKEYLRSLRASPWCCAPAIPAPMMMPPGLPNCRRGWAETGCSSPRSVRCCAPPQRDICVSCSRW